MIVTHDECNTAFFSHFASVLLYEKNTHRCAFSKIFLCLTYSTNGRNKQQLSPKNVFRVPKVIFFDPSIFLL